MSYIISFLFLCIFSWGILRWRFFNIQGVSRKTLLFAFIIKICAGIILTVIYTKMYPVRQEADTFRYFDDSYHLHEALRENPKAYLKMLFASDQSDELMTYLDRMNNWFPAERTALYNDNRTVIRINALLRLVSFGNYYTHLIFFCLFAFYGLTFIYKAFHRYFPGKKIYLFYILFFTPSLLFWSSGILKEAPLLLFFGITLNILNKIFTKRSRRIHYILLTLCFLALFHLKFYVGLLLIPATTAYLWILNPKGPPAIVKGGLNYLGYFGLAVIWHKINWNWSLFTVLKWKRKDFIGLAESMNAKSLIQTGDLEDNPISFLINIPQGLWNSLARPYLSDVYSIVLLPNAIENLLIFILIIICLVKMKKVLFHSIGYFFILYSVSLLAIIGMVTPILGSLVRYKIPALPLFLFFFLLIADIKDWKTISILKRAKKLDESK